MKPGKRFKFKPCRNKEIKKLLQYQRDKVNRELISQWLMEEYIRDVRSLEFYISKDVLDFFSIDEYKDRDELAFIVFEKIPYYIGYSVFGSGCSKYFGIVDKVLCLVSKKKKADLEDMRYWVESLNIEYDFNDEMIT